VGQEPSPSWRVAHAAVAARAGAAIREGIDILPVACPDEQAFEIRLLHDHQRSRWPSAPAIRTGCAGI
jgi:hypothetical protein